MNFKFTKQAYFKRDKLLKIIMRTFIFLFCTLSFAIGTKKGFSQNATITIKSDRTISIKQVFKMINKQTDYKFIYRYDLIKDAPKLFVNKGTIKASELLEKGLSPINFTYTFTGNNTVIVKAKPTDLVNANSSKKEDEQQKEISGNVTDESGIPLPAVNIAIEGSDRGTETNFDGYYVIKASKGDVLTFSYIGMEAFTTTVGDSNTIDVILKQSAESILEEVVLIGYGTKKKVNLTGAVTTVDVKTLETRATGSLLKSLQGAMAGVTIIDRPGQSISVNIRGHGNLGVSSPLYIVDGIEVSANFFNNIDPTSIANFSVLKDASSTAIYGSKAAFGVVLVTTKSGRNGVMTVNYNGSIGTQQATYIPKVVNSWEYAELYREAELNSGITEDNLRYSLEDVAKYRDGSNPDLYPNTNWFNLILKENPVFTKHSWQFSGGGEKNKNIMSIGYLKDDSFIPGETNSRYNFNLKSTVDVKPWLSVNGNVNFIYSKYQRKGPLSYIKFVAVPPTQVAIHTNGNWGAVRDISQPTGEDANDNPLRILNEGGRANTNTKRLIGSIKFEIKPFDGLKIMNQLSYNYFDNKSFRFQNTRAGIPSFIHPNSGDVPGTASSTNQMNIVWKFSERISYDGWVSYDKTFGEKSQHNFSGIVGMHADDYTFKDLSVARKDFASNDFNALDGGSTDPDLQLVSEGKVLEESTLSFFGRATYAYNEKYLLETSVRADASSRFSKEGRWGYFPSMSAGWRIDKEDFALDLDWMTLLKLRGSFGISGNINNVGLYDTYSTFQSNGTTVINGKVVSLLEEGRIGNSLLTWETSKTTDIGLDANIENGLLNLSFDYYNRVTDDILIRANDVLTETGLNSSNIPARNVGSVRNRGIELSLSHKNKIGDVSFEIGGNLSANKNKITDLGKNVDQLPPTDYWIFRTGESIGDFFMYQADGLYSTTDIANGDVIPFGEQVPEAGMIKFVDQLTVDSDGDGIPDKADGVINSDDRTIVANDAPSFTYGGNIHVRYKNFSLSAIGQGVSGIKVFLENETSQAFFNGAATPREWQKNNHWTPENQTNAYPKLFKESDLRYKYNNIASSYWLFNAAYFRVKNVTLDYTIPEKIVSSIGLNTARIYVSGDNLLTIRGDKRMKDFDPERSSGRSTQLGTKTYTVGLSLTF